MGCWLIVGCFSLNRMWKDSCRQQAGYEPVSTGEAESDSVSPIVKGLVKNDDGRVPITGSKVLLLAIPACCDIAGTTLMNVGFLFVAASSEYSQAPKDSRVTNPNTRSLPNDPWSPCPLRWRLQRPLSQTPPPSLPVVRPLCCCPWCGNCWPRWCSLRRRTQTHRD